MKEVKKQTEVVLYEAIDGELFEEKEECILYEKTAKAVINAKFKALVTNEQYAWDLMGGYDDHKVFAIKMKTENDKDTVVQRYLLDNTFLCKEDNAERLERFIGKVTEIYNKKETLLLAMNCEDSLYMLDSAEHYIENIKNFIA